MGNEDVMDFGGGDDDGDDDMFNNFDRQKKKTISGLDAALKEAEA